MNRTTPLLLGLLAITACDVGGASRTVDREYIGAHRLVNAKFGYYRETTQYRTRILVDDVRGQVRELREITTALGDSLEPEITIWGVGGSGFAKGTRSSCEIFNSNNFVCRAWPDSAGLEHDAAHETVLERKLQMKDGALTEISGLDTIHYQVRGAAQPRTPAGVDPRFAPRSRP